MTVRVACLAGAALAGSLGAPAFAQERETVFVLGRVEATAKDSAGLAIGGAQVAAEEMRTFNRVSVDQAVDLIPGASSGATGGARNERLIFVRGFDRFQTTLSIDGVRVFLPSDNRIDFGRFLTADIAEVQISKGYVSVLDGPGGLGGAVNLVTRKPTKAFEIEAEAGLDWDRELDQTGAHLSGLVGTRQDRYFVQASGTQRTSQGFTLSDSFVPNAPALEDGGRRGNSDSRDWRVNFKAGITPNDTDEYAVSWIRQEGEKNAPYHVYDTASARFWSWPYWDIDSLQLATRTQIAPGAVVRTRIYRNQFDNLLSAFDDASQTTQSQLRAFNSYYADESWGGAAWLDLEPMAANKLSAALHFRRDQHTERQDGFVRAPAEGSPFAFLPFSETPQTFEEDTWSVAIEDTLALSPNLDLVAGVSYDWTDLREAEDVNVRVTGSTLATSAIVFDPVTYDAKDRSALNGQAALSWRIAEGQRLYASVSSRARFATLFERFSSRFGQAIPNPGIKPERATSYEIGGETEFGAHVKASGAVFYSDLKDALISIPVAVGPPFGTIPQAKNAGSGEYYGAEASLTAEVMDELTLGGNYTWLHRELTDPTNPAFEPQGVPEHKLFAYAAWHPLPALAVTPSVQWESERWTVTTSSLIKPPKFYETGSHVSVGLALDWAIDEHMSLLLTARNLTDANYQLVDGFPEEGRSVSLSLRLRN